MEEQDDRLQLRIIDIKLTAEASPSYFDVPEVVYYATVLAGWLEDLGPAGLSAKKRLVVS